MKKITVTLLICISYLNGFTQLFTPLDSEIVGVYNSDVVWCDFDFDGDSDFIINGRTATGTIGNSYGGISIIYENKGDYFEIFDTLNLHEKGALVITDFNNDNVNDVLSVGYVSLSATEVERHSVIYLNYSGFDFDVLTTANLTGLSDGDATTGDLNNDGKTDIIMYGRDINNVYGIRTYIKTDLGYEAFDMPYASEMRNVDKIEIFDIDNDGDNDIIFCGNNLGTSINGLKIYKNNGNLNFELLESVITPSFTPSHITLIDINSDGLMDFIISSLNGSYSNSDPSTSAYINIGNLEFEVIQDLGIPGLATGDMISGDVNNDGQSDILACGMTYIDGIGYKHSSKLYINNNGTFHNSYDFHTAFVGGTCSFADIDNDGDLDLLICGLAGYDDIMTVIYKNQLITKGKEKNLQIPANLNSSISEEGITFSWDPVLSPTPHTYNLYVGTTPNGTDIISPSSNLITGKMHSPGYGNVGFNTTYTLNNLPEGNYYWSVQAINAAYQSSEFATEETVIYSGIVNNINNVEVHLSSNPLTENSYLQILNHTNGVKSDLIIYSLDGKLITKISSYDDKIILNSNNFSQGLYFYQLFILGKSYSGKFSVVN